MRWKLKITTWNLLSPNILTPTIIFIDVMQKNLDDDAGTNLEIFPKYFTLNQLMQLCTNW